MNPDSIGVAVASTTRGSDGANALLADFSNKHDAPDGAKKIYIVGVQESTLSGIILCINNTNQLCEPAAEYNKPSFPIYAVVAVGRP